MLAHEYASSRMYKQRVIIGLILAFMVALILTILYFKLVRL